MPLEQVNIGTAENDPNADTLRAAFEKVNALVVATNQAQSDLAAMVEALAGKAPASHTHAIGQVDGLQAALEGKAPASSIWTQEQLQDLVAAMFQTGTHSNASITYDDDNGSLSITASGGGPSLTEEEVEDFVGGLIVQGTGISVAYDDAGNVLSISLAGESYTTAEKNKLAGIAAGATANATDAQLRDRSTHTGVQPISSIDQLQGALNAKAALSHSHALGDVSGLTAALAAKAELAEIVAARSGRASLEDRLSLLANFASPNAGAFIPGRYYNSTFAANSSQNWQHLNNAVILSPFFNSTDLIFDQIGMLVVTAGSADAVGRCFIYDSGPDGWPRNPILETPDLSLASAGFKSYDLPAKMTLQRSTMYWLGQRFGNPTTNATMRAINLSSSVNLGLVDATSHQYSSVILRQIALTTALPAPWTFTESDLRGNTPPPSVRMRYQP